MRPLCRLVTRFDGPYLNGHRQVLGPNFARNWMRLRTAKLQRQRSRMTGSLIEYSTDRSGGDQVNQRLFIGSHSTRFHSSRARDFGEIATGKFHQRCPRMHLTVRWHWSICPYFLASRVLELTTTQISTFFLLTNRIGATEMVIVTSDKCNTENNIK